MRALPPLPPAVISLSSGSHLALPSIKKMSALAASSSFSSLAAMASASSTSAAAAASTAAASAATPIAPSWISAVAGNKHWVGSAWILSSALLTTYSTTKFLKYRGEDEDGTSSQSSAGGSSKSMLRRFGSVLNSTENRPDEQLAGGRKRRSAGKPGLSRASLLTLYRFSGSLLLGLVIHSHFYDLSQLLPRFLQTVEAAKMFLLPSLFLFIANYSNSIALDRIGISLTYTSKCGIPLITVLFTLLLDGMSALPSTATLLSLLPIAVGIGAASWNSPTFEMFGFLAAMLSTTSQAALNVVSKRVMRKTGVRGPDAQRAMVLVALGIGLIMTCANNINNSLRELREYGANVRNVATENDGGGVQAAAPAAPPLWLTCLAVLAYHTEYVLSFSFVGLVEPITYGTCDAMRRLLIIVAGRQMFGGETFTKTNLGGIFMALLGALMYSITSSAKGGILKNG